MTETHLLSELRQYLSAVHKRRWLTATSLALTLIAATLYNYTTRPVYRAVAQILIDRDAPRVLPNPNLAVDQGSADYFQTQYELLRGRTLAQQVVESLKLHEQAEFQMGARVSPWERLHGPPRVELQPLPVAATANAFRSRLTVEPLPGGHLVNLYFWAYDPELAAKAVNELAHLYMVQSIELRSTVSSEAGGWLSERVAAEKEKSDGAERALQEFREKEGLVNVEERQGLMDQKLAGLSAALVNARTERIGKETLLAQMRSLPALQLSTFPTMMDKPNVQKARGELVELQAEEARLSETLGERHPDMQKLRARVASAEEKLKLEIAAMLGAVEAGCEAARQQERGLSEALEAAKREALVLNRAEVQYGVLKRDVDTHQQLLRELTGRSQQTALETELKSSNIRLVEKAEVPRGPILPRTSWNYQLALAAGLLLGLGLAVLFDRLDNTVKTPEEIKALGLPFLGMIPELKLAGEERGEDGPHVVQKPHSPVAEAYRVLRTNVLFSSAEASGRVLLVTSANPGEGKTTTVANLAASLAENGAKVLAIDADLRRPTLHQHFGREKTPGLSDAIVGACLTAQALQPTRQKGLQILPCGYLPPNPTELLGAASTRELIGALRKRYDWVLIDAPPVLAMADTPVLAPWADGVVLVVWADVCPRPALQRTVDQLKAVGGKITGVVLNKVDLARNSYYYSQHYGEYYRSYYETSEPGRPADGSRGGLHSV